MFVALVLIAAGLYQLASNTGLLDDLMNGGKKP